MKKSFIILTIAAVIAATPAMRADDLSDLVAAVAGAHTVKSHDFTTDGIVTVFDSLPAYTPSKNIHRSDDIDLALLDGVANAMTMHDTFNSFLRLSTPSYRHPEPQIFDQNSRPLPPPTLAMQGFFRPVPGGVTSKFGWRPQFQRMHHGIDLHLNMGDTVRAALSGVITHIGYDHDGYGHYVVMTHPDGMETLYGHLQYALVSQGLEIEAGDPVGIGGNTGNSTGPHLHFEARVGGVAVDPSILFDFYGNFPYVPHTIADADENPAASRHSLSGKRTYVVKYGDTPKSVARRAGISVSTLCRLNMMKSTDRLEVGRRIKLR